MYKINSKKLSINILKWITKPKEKNGKNDKKMRRKKKFNESQNISNMFDIYFEIHVYLVRCIYKVL